MSSTAQRPPAAASLVLFARGVIARLKIWPILRIAVQESWGGPKSADKRTWLASEIVDAFEQQEPPPDDQYVEELVLQVMADEFDCVVEDGSGEEVGKDVVQLWQESRTGKQDMVLKFEELAEKMKGKRVDAQITTEEDEVDGDGDDDEWEEGESGDDEEMRLDSRDEVPQLIDRRLNKERPDVDEDGFTLVKRK
jgi:pre-rRNA-processing protein TSR2